ncbi:sprouty-related, EVH1 domain-containing protein 1-like [Brienomyrus brachyistius]|uniref:sprouty-related, EVH1 domain-containing protein 1-like n=1 Tax=Brienomyrus brachyistius TaxID=42636 RepID=UPI0020B32EAB|nr:sprouty-related, EVH1 domain-containing protein 1-like [Brienomyrus brachyistius]
MERDVVRVRAVVMTRDDSSGGWVPLGGGGLSHVVICKGQSPEAKGHTKYFVRGERLRDRAPVLDCAVQRGLVYNKVNPIFHHWRVEERKFGLTFQSPADAVSFERGLRSVIDWMDRGATSPVLCAPEEGDPGDESKPSRTDSESSFNSRKETLPKPITIVTSESSSTSFVHPPASEDLSYRMKHTVTAQTPAMVHVMPLQHQPSSIDASGNPAATPPPATPSPPTPATRSPLTPTMLPAASSPLSAPPLPLLDHGDLKDLWGTRGYEDYRRAEMRRTAGEGGLQDKSELCAVHFEKDQARVGVGGAEVAVMLDSKLPQRLSAGSPTSISAPNAVTSPGESAGSPLRAGLSSPLPCCIHTSIAKPRSRSWKRGAGARGAACTKDCGLSLGLFGLSSTDGATRPTDDTASPPAALSSPTSRCIYCRSVFSTSDNGRGRCQDAPDPALRCLRQWTCVWCAESLLYHCTSDPEGEFWEPCSCEELPGEWPHAACCARWVALLALSLLVPCMCCYLPLCACLRCGEQCGCCGGKHKAVR